MLNKFIVFLAGAYYWLAERLYHELAWAYDPISWLVSLGQWGDWRRSALPLIQGDRVLEVGFGTAELLFEISRAHPFTVGLDASAAMQRVATRKIRKLGLVIPRLQGVSQALPFRSTCFDAVVSTFPSNYIFDPGTWTEAARVLRPAVGEASPGGSFIVVGVGLVGSRGDGGPRPSPMSRHYWAK